MKTALFWVSLAVLLTAAATTTSALYISGDPIVGTYDWLADVRFRNFTNNNNGDYEMMVNYSPTRTPGPLQVNGHVPGGNRAYWAENNDFWITYDPLANQGAGNVSQRLVGSGRTNYDVTIGHAPDACARPINIIQFELYDRNAFPTFTNGVTISSLDGVNLGTFTLPQSGSDTWWIVDPGGALLDNGFILQGNFVIDPTMLDGGREGDKIAFGIGNNPGADVPEPGMLVFLGIGLVGLAGLRRKLRK